MSPGVSLNPSVIFNTYRSQYCSAEDSWNVQFRNFSVPGFVVMLQFKPWASHTSIISPLIVPLSNFSYTLSLAKITGSMPRCGRHLSNDNIFSRPVLFFSVTFSVAVSIDFVIFATSVVASVTAFASWAISSAYSVVTIHLNRGSFPVIALSFHVLSVFKNVDISWIHYQRTSRNISE